MSSGIFQRLLLHITCLCFAASLTKSKHVENAFTYLISISTKCFAKQWLAHSLYTHCTYCISHPLYTNITTPSILINFAVL